MCNLFWKLFQAINKARREGAVIDTQVKCKYKLKHGVGTHNKPYFVELLLINISKRVNIYFLNL